MDKVLELWDTGTLTMQEVGDQCGITKQRVKQILDENNRDGRKRLHFAKDHKKQLYGEAIRQVRKLYRNGVALSHAYKEIGVTAHICQLLWKADDDDRKAHLMSKLLNKTEVGEIPLGFDEPCRHWKGYIGQGRPIFAHSNNGERRAHYILYEWVTGEKPPRGAKQLCGNTDCVEPSHLG